MSEELSGAPVASRMIQDVARVELVKMSETWIVLAACESSGKARLAKLTASRCDEKSAAARMDISVVATLINWVAEIGNGRQSSLKNMPITFFMEASRLMRRVHLFLTHNLT